MLSKLEHYKHYTFWYKEIENYEKALKDPEKLWVTHHRLELQFSDGTPRPVNAQLTSDELIALGCYFDRPPEELIFLTNEDHRRLHSLGQSRIPWNKGLKGQIPWNKGKKGFNHSEETKQKMSESRKGHLVLEKTKIKISNAKKGKHWFNNGVTCVCCFECPEGFVPGMLKGSSKNAENR